MRRNFYFKLLYTLTASILVLSLFAADSFSYYRRQYVPDEVIVKFKDQEPEARIHNIIGANGAHLIRKSRSAGFHLIKTSGGKTPEQMVELLQQDPDVEYAELNYYAHAAFVPNDPLYINQWNFNKDNGINIEPVWDLTTGDPNVIIAVIDSGVAYEDYNEYHLAPDLANTHFVPGYDFINDDNHPNDDEGHGTHVCGTIAESTNNGLGVAGIAFNCSIMPVKVLDVNGNGPYSAVVDGIHFAVDNGAKVINLSLAGDTDSWALKNAVKYAYENDVTVVAAAGNDYLNGNPPRYPAAYDQYCIAVGATRYNRTRATYSNTGSYVDLVAPGGDTSAGGHTYHDGILQQTIYGDPATFQYRLYTGTSMATPHVSAVAGLLASTGVTSPDSIREALQNTAIDLGAPNRDDEYGYGIINAFAAIRYFATPGDFNFDGLVDFADLKILCDHWLQNAPGIEIYPPGGDGNIDFFDYNMFVNLLPQ